MAGSQSPAGVVTPPESPPAPAAAATTTTADVEMEEAAPEPAVEEKAVLKEEGEAERDSENVKGEVRTEVAKEEA